MKIDISGVGFLIELLANSVSPVLLSHIQRKYSQNSLIFGLLSVGRDLKI